MILETNSDLRQCYIGIGSNLDNPLQHVNIAINQLKAAQRHYLGRGIVHYIAPPQ